MDHIVTRRQQNFDTEVVEGIEQQRHGAFLQLPFSVFLCFLSVSSLFPLCVEVLLSFFCSFATFAHNLRIDSQNKQSPK
jgi:uncharacterized membrane protein